MRKSGEAISNVDCVWSWWRRRRRQGDDTWKAGTNLEATENCGSQASGGGSRKEKKGAQAGRSSKSWLLKPASLNHNTVEEAYETELPKWLMLSAVQTETKRATIQKMWSLGRRLEFGL